MQDTALSSPSPPEPMPAAPEQLASWVRLMQTPGVGPATCAVLLDSFSSPLQIFQSGLTRLRAIVGPALADALLHPGAALLKQVDDAVAWAGKSGNHIISVHDPRYPPALRHYCRCAAAAVRQRPGAALDRALSGDGGQP